MMDLSFRWPFPRLDTPLGQVSVRLHTFENVYAMDPASLETLHDAGTVTLRSTRLAWAGGQRTCEGRLELRVIGTGTGTGTDGELRLTVTGHHPDGVRSVAITLHDQRTGRLTHLREGAIDITEAGRIIRYPDGWWDLATAHLVVEQPERTPLSIRSTDHLPRPKTLAFVPHFDDPALMEIELLLEADASEPSATLDAPAWAVQRTADIAPLVAAHRRHVAEAFPADPWVTRADVPDWARGVGLVLTLHGQHYTGRTFLTYDDALDRIKQVSEWVDPTRLLAYLPGWEGRYYRWYGRYDTDDSLGGAAGFARLVDGAHGLGVHVMPMFGANIASRDIPGFERWGEPGRQLTASGLAPVGSVDWDASRHFDHGFGAVITTAYQPWRRHLINQIATLQRRFGFDASFLDISAMYANDPRGRTTDGIRALVTELHDAIHNHLVAGEGWFDAIADVVPLVQAGHRLNIPAYHDVPDEELFTRTNRAFGHVNLGDAAHGSSGVHEAGYVRAWRTPVRRGVVPTMSIVDDTLASAPDRVRLIIADAQEYIDRYL